MGDSSCPWPGVDLPCFFPRLLVGVFIFDFGDRAALCSVQLFAESPVPGLHPSLFGPRSQPLGRPPGRGTSGGSSA